jgi:tagatose 1,6-diphosphate aldolase
MAIQAQPRLTAGKIKGMTPARTTTRRHRAAAMDQRGSLKREIGNQGGQPASEALTEFKTAVTKVLTPHASHHTDGP